MDSTGGPKHQDLAYRCLLRLLDEGRFAEVAVRAGKVLADPELDPLVRASIHNLVCWAQCEGYERPSLDAALHGERAVRMARRLGAWGLFGEALLNVALACYLLGRLQPARRAYQEVLAVRGNLLPAGRPWQVLAWAGLGLVALTEGHLAAALAAYGEAEARLPRGGRSELAADIFRQKALVLLGLGRMDEAAALLQRLADQAAYCGRRLHPRQEALFTLALAKVRWAQGEAGAAALLARRAIAAATAAGDSAAMAEGYLCLQEWAPEGGAGRLGRRALRLALASGRPQVLRTVRQRLAAGHRNGEGVAG